MRAFLQDIRFGFRTLAKRPGFMVAAVLTLALGIGANTAIFSVVHGLMYRLLPVPDADRLTSIVERSRLADNYLPISFPDYRDFSSLDSVFEGVTAFAPRDAQVTVQGVPERVMVTVTTGNYFSVLGLQPQIGRAYTAADGDLGGHPSVVLSHGYWRSRFGSDPAIVGRTLKLNDVPVTVAAVTPESFPGTIGFVATHVYAPFSLWEQVRPGFRDSLEDRSNWSWRTVGRLQKGVSLEEADSAVSAVSANLQQEYPESNKDLRAFVLPEPLTRLEPTAADYMPIVSTIFMSMVGLVLLIACANVTNLLLARAAGRSKEVAVRAALGAGRLRILRQLLTESVVLALLGGAFGLGIAHWATGMLSSIKVATDMPLYFDFSINYEVFAYAVAISLAVGVLSGLAPGLSVSRTNLSDTLKEGLRGTSSLSRQPLRSALVTAQMAVSLVLLICTGLFMQSMFNIRQIDPGFEMEGRFMLSMDARLRNYEEEKGSIFFRDLLERVRALSAVRGAATAFSVPMGFNGVGGRVYPEGRSDSSAKEEESFLMGYNIVSSGYFTTMGVDLLQGRPITEQDRRDSRLVAVINQFMAEQLWPGQEAIGQRFSLDNPEGPFMEVVGVAQNGYYSVPGESYNSHFYVPETQRYRSTRILFVNSAADPAALLPSIRREIAALDPDMPVFEVRSLRTHVEDGKAAILFGLPSALTGAFALIGLVLAATGLYGVISYSVTQRTHEIGLRVALGATTGSIVRLISRKGLGLAAAGIVLGCVAAVAVTGMFGGLLIGVSARDPFTYTGVSALLLLLALAASALPARFRASAIDPVDALRGE